MAKSLEEKLEEFKKLGVYDVQLWFGEGVGCDDLDIPLYERKLWVIGVPVGCLGACKVFYKGTVKDFLSFNFKANVPTVVPNPPKNLENKKGNWFIWGIDDAVKIILKKWYGIEFKKED